METKTMDENVFNFIYGEAMKDAIMQKAYPGEKKPLYKICKSDEKIKYFIESVLNGKFADYEKNHKEYDDAFLETVNHVCDKINKERGDYLFTFGNAQKLLNIMLKYFYITCYGQEDKRKNFCCCHCPMDQIMLKKVWDKRGNDPLLDSEGIQYKGTDFLGSWGREGYKEDNYPISDYPNRYKAFQAAVRALANKENLYPLEYDYSVWGNQADGE